MSSVSNGNEEGSLTYQVQQPPVIRKHTSIRIDPYLWGLFMERTHALGLSACIILEGLMRAWITGQVTQVAQPRPLTVNMRVDYVVQRHRRGPPERLAPFGERRCLECGSNQVYEFQPEDTNYFDGRCRKCGARWLLAPGDQNPRGV